VNFTTGTVLVFFPQYLKPIFDVKTKERFIGQERVEVAF
jgi:hypothetical protein